MLVRNVHTGRLHEIPDVSSYGFAGPPSHYAPPALGEVVYDGLGNPIGLIPAIIGAAKAVLPAIASFVAPAAKKLIGGLLPRPQAPSLVPPTLPLPSPAPILPPFPLPSPAPFLPSPTAPEPPVMMPPPAFPVPPPYPMAPPMPMPYAPGPPMMPGFAPYPYPPSPFMYGPRPYPPLPYPFLPYWGARAPRHRRVRRK